jgi:hypothetical protein
MAKEYTTRELAEMYGVTPLTVRLWCDKGLFPNAEKKESPRGPYWSIPARDLKSFKPPSGPGRPRDKNPSEAALKKRQLRDSKKES